MRYILDDSGYIYSVSCNPIECNNKGCTEYTGTVPSGYISLQQWATTANIRAYKIVNGNLTYDADRAAALEAEWAITGKVGEYSGEERIVGKYYDGHVIFQKTFYGASTSDGNATLGTIENLDVIIGCEGFFLKSGTKTCWVFGSDTMSVYQTDNTINFSSNKNVSGWYSLTIKYLKTTH